MKVIQFRAAGLLLLATTLTPSMAHPAATDPGQPGPGTGTLLVANQASASATIIDIASGAAVHLEVGAGPHEAAISADGLIGVISIYGAQTPGNRLAVIDMAAARVLRTIDLGEYTRPHDVRFLPDHARRVAVTSESTQRVVIVNVEEGTVVGAAETRAQGSHMLGFSSDGRRLFTANIGSGSVSEISLLDLSFVREIPVASRTEGVAVTPDGGEVWVGSNDEGTVSVVDTSSGEIARVLTGFDFPYRLAISADGRVAAVCDARVGVLHIIDVSSRETLRRIEGLGSPRGITLDSDGGRAFVTLAQGEAVVLDTASGEVVQTAQVGQSPDGIAFSPVSHPRSR